MNIKKSSPNTAKKRNWVMIVYPTKLYLDSINSKYDGSDGYGTSPDNWMDILQSSGCPCVISPLHCDDKNPDNTLKKPHWHIIICYKGPTSYNVVKKLTDSLNAPPPQQLEQIKGYYRYLTHKDNPDKAQYLEEDIKTLNGFNILDYIEITHAETLVFKKFIINYIRDNKITEYSVLLNMLADNEMNVEFDIASSNTILFNTYIRSCRYYVKEKTDFYENNKEQSIEVDIETGEVIE